ncbi:hypothetical protein MPL1032_130042 [Mesorhizobium plurifarium]|uniref:Uncharacterized protein n=1 Tax=Mesorhizobium plurifarium TaxID=69974 RepID=A0A0K2VQX0_MESPL|nr:hypothetical protein MPL1032_130042 [Mesorhizobium plurifarium]
MLAGSAAMSFWARSVATRVECEASPRGLEVTRRIDMAVSPWGWIETFHANMGLPPYQDNWYNMYTIHQ